MFALYTLAFGHRVPPHDECAAASITPVNLERVWKGKIESVYSSFVLIFSLDEGYEGLREAVWPSQIVKIARNAHVESFKV
jgi:hypothetical protein